MFVKLARYILLKSNLLIYKGARNGGKIAVTFDDGPHLVYTERILHILNKENVKATFFIIGKEAEQQPELIKLAAKSGHQIANHSYEHMKNSNITAGIRKTEGVIQEILGRPSGFFRPPWGKVTFKLSLYCLFNKMKIVLWSVDSRDFACKSHQELLQYVKKCEIEDGDIILFHEDYAHTIEALPEIISYLKSKGMGFCTVKDLTELR